MFFFKFKGGESTSPDPCSDIYHGTGPFSEPETRAIEKFVNDTEAEGTEFLAYMTLHSYANVCLKERASQNLVRHSILHFFLLDVASPLGLHTWSLSPRLL